MNQILITEKMYVTPEMKRKKLIYKIEFTVSIFLFCLLFSYYIYAEYDKNKAEQTGAESLANINTLQYEDFVVNKDVTEDKETIKKATDDDIIMLVLNEEEEDKHKDEVKRIDVNIFDNKVYKTKSGTEYKQDAILKIPSIGLEYPVLSKTSEELLWISLNKYWGPEPNEIGNYCIAGHYYQSGKMFGNLHKLQNGDTAELTDSTGKTIEYQVYDQYVVEPDNTSCTSQLTGGKREITLITCTNHSKQRRIIKLREV